MQEFVARSVAFGTFKNVQIGSPSGAGSPPTNTANTRNTAQQSSSTLSTRKIGDWQEVVDPEGANAWKGTP
ncbi:Spore coat protein, partial [Bacillus gaemokensis]